MIRQSPVSVEELALAGQGDRAARDRRHAAGEDRRPARDRRDPRGDEAEGEVPGLAGRGDADPRASARRPCAGSTTSSASPASTSCARPPSSEQIRDAQGPRAEGRGERARGARRSSARRARPSGCCSPRCSRSPRSWRRRCASTRPPTRSRSPARRGAGRDLQGHRPDRDRRATRRRSPMALTEHALAAAVGLGGQRPGRGSPPTTGSRSTCGSSTPDAYGNLLQHFTGSSRAQRRAARARGEDGALGLRARDRSRPRRATVERYATEAEVYERLGLAYIEPELREGSGEIAAAAEGELPELVELERHPRRPALPHDALGRPQLARADGRGRAASAATPTWRSPTTPPATGSATT